MVQIFLGWPATADPFFNPVSDTLFGTVSALSASRADYIAEELLKRGISSKYITEHATGGINTYSPSEANRHTRVELHF